MAIKPSPKQVAFLQAREVQVPPTSRSASTLIAYILKGNATAGATETERLAILKTEQSRLHNKNVKSRKWGNSGQVLYVYAKGFAEVVEARRDAGSSPLPFVAVVKWNGDGEAEAGTRPVSPLDLEVTVDPTSID